MLTKKGFLAPLVLVITTFGCLFGQTCERAVTLTGIYSETQVQSQDFIVDLNGEPLTVSRVEPIENRIVVLVQADRYHVLGHSKDFRNLVKKLVGIFTEQVPPNTLVAYGVFATRVKLASGFSRDPSQLRGSLNDLIQRSKTGALGQGNEPYHALEVALDFLAYPSEGNTRDSQPGLRRRPKTKMPGGDIILVTDEVPGRLRTEDATDMLREFRDQSVRLFVVVPEEPVTSGPTDVGFDFMLDFASSTGGGAEHLSTSMASKKEEQENWRKERNFWSNGLGRGYTVTIQFPSDMPKQGTWSLYPKDPNQFRRGIPTGKAIFEWPIAVRCQSNQNYCWPKGCGSD